MWLAPSQLRNLSARTCPTLPPLTSWLFALLSACAGSSEPNHGQAYQLEAQAQTSAAAGDTCTRMDGTSKKAETNVWLVIDGSGSMSDPLSPTENTSRWQALRGALLDPTTGVVGERQNDVKWGMLMYDGPLPTGTAGAPTACPRLVTVEPKLNNLTAIEAAYPADPLGGSTPTDKALAALLARLPDPATTNDPRASSNIVVLATDGMPNDFCASAAQASDVRSDVIELVEAIEARDTPVYVISLAGADDELAQHLEQVAAAGGTHKPFFPQVNAQLTDDFRKILGPAAKP